MNRLLQAYMQEFPFLKEIIGDSIPDSVHVKRADENLLALTPNYFTHVGSLGETNSWKKVHFVLCDGVIIKDAVKQEEEFSSNYAGDSPYISKGETVLEAIDRHGVAETLKFIVVEKYYYSNWEGKELREEYTITIYKPPKDTTFEAEIEKAKAQALSKVRAEADF